MNHWQNTPVIQDKTMFGSNVWDSMGQFNNIGGSQIPGGLPQIGDSQGGAISIGANGSPSFLGRAQMLGNSLMGNNQEVPGAMGGGTGGLFGNAGSFNSIANFGLGAYQAYFANKMFNQQQKNADRTYETARDAYYNDTRNAHRARSAFNNPTGQTEKSFMKENRIG